MLRRIVLTFACLTLFSLPTAVHAQGFVLPGIGPTNRSVGGAGTAAALDATGALHWNPAVILDLPESRVDLRPSFSTRDTMSDRALGHLRARPTAILGFRRSLRSVGSIATRRAAGRLDWA